jgi:hypothetical protein
MQQPAVTDALDPGYLANVARVRSASFYADALRPAERSRELRAVTMNDPTVWRSDPFLNSRSAFAPGRIRARTRRNGYDA